MVSVLLVLQQNNDGAAAGMFSTLISLAFAAVIIAGMWKVFTKAGQPGWAAIVPIYNVYVMLKIAGKPAWWLLLMFVPVVNFFVALVMSISLAQAFGKGAGFGLGLFFLSPIFIPLLGFGSARYLGTATPGMVSAPA